MASCPALFSAKERLLLFSIILGLVCHGQAQQPGSVDPTFDAELSPATFLKCVALQNDGKVLIGGRILLRGRTQWLSLVRLQPNGRLDPAFQLNDLDIATQLAVQDDGKILVASEFLNPPVRRLHPDGTIDPSFRFSDEPQSFATYFRVSSMAVQPDRKALIVTSEITIGGEPIWLFRLEENGDLDPTFSLDSNLIHQSPRLTSLLVQSDGKILVHKWFANDDSFEERCLVRLFPDGAEDVDFFPESRIREIEGSEGEPLRIRSVAIAPDSTIFVGVYADLDLTRVYAITPSGEIDPDFEPILLQDNNNGGLTLQNDGKLLVFGRSMHRFLPGGGIDEAFQTEEFGAGAGVYPRNVFSLPEGKILAAYRTDASQPLPGYNLVRLHADEAEPHAPIILAGPQDQTAIQGAVSMFEVYAEGYPPPEYQWKHNGENIPGATSRALRFKRTELRDQGTYSVTVSNDAGEAQSGEATLTVFPPSIQPGAIDDRFRPEEIEEAVDIKIHEIALLPGGGLLAARYVEFADGSRLNEMIKLDSDGDVDPDYHAVFDTDDEDTRYNLIRKIYAYNTGEALVGGYFKTVNGQEQPGLVRLDAKGNMDPDFRPRFEPDPEDIRRPGPPFDYEPAKISIRTVYVQPDGSILVGGDFFSVNGVEIKPLGIVRLLESGELDDSFQITEYPFSTNPAFRPEAVSAIRFVEDKILISSRLTFFVDLNGAWVDGYRTSVGSGPNVSVDNQGRILVTRAGSRIGIQGITREAIWRLLPDLGMDLDFEPVFYLDGLPTNRVSCNAVQRDGKILMGGGFEEFSGVRRNGLVRLNEDGSLDETFSPGRGIARTPYGGLSGISIADNGTIYITGEFDQFDGYSRQGIARLLGDPELRFERPLRRQSTFAVQARTVNGESYVWEYTSSLANPQWKTVREVEGDGLFQTLEDPAATDEMRWYRLRERVQ